MKTYVEAEIKEDDGQEIDAGELAQLVRLGQDLGLIDADGAIIPLAPEDATTSLTDPSKLTSESTIDDVLATIPVDLAVTAKAERLLLHGASTAEIVIALRCSEGCVSLARKRLIQACAAGLIEGPLPLSITHAQSAAKRGRKRPDNVARMTIQHANARSKRFGEHEPPTKKRGGPW